LAEGTNRAVLTSRSEGALAVNRTDIECGVKQHRHPDEVTCPVDCPFLRKEPTGFCDFKCVPKEQCSSDDPLTSFADLSSMHCRPCLVDACTICGDTAQTCTKCHGSFDLIDGQCISRYKLIWHCLYLLLGILVGVVVAYVIVLGLRGTINREILEIALQYRSSSKMRGGDGALLDLMKTNVKRTYSSGLGVALHFEWQFAMILWSVVVLIVFYILSLSFPHRPPAQKHSPESFSVCDQGMKAQEEELGNMEISFFYAVLFLYIFTTCASIAYAIWQRRWATRKSLERTTMQDFMMVASGLPCQPGSEPVETDLAAFFQSAFAKVGAEVVGVSICWDLSTMGEKVEEHGRRELDEQELHHELHIGEVKSRTFERSPRRAREIESWKCGCLSIDPKMRCFDKLLGIEERAAVEARRDSDLSLREVTSLLENMTGSGDAYIIFRTEGQRDRALEYAEKQPVMYPFGVPPWCQHRLTFHTDDLEPDTVLWSGFGISNHQVGWRIAKGICWLLLAIGALDVCFYFPYVTYLMRCSEISGMTQGDLVQSTLLGLLICICNQIIYAIIGKIADGCGFKHKDTHQRFYVVAYTAAVFINTIIDLCTVALLAQGYSVDQALEMQITNDSVMSTKAIATNYSLQMSLYVQTWAYIFPSCLLLPFMLEPLAQKGIYFLYCWLVGSRKVSAQDAELVLQCPPFDLARYGDILINLMLCAILCVFTYRDLWTIWACLVVSLAWIYMYDRYRFLRLSTRRSFVSQKLSTTSHWLASTPCAILLAVLTFRVYCLADNRGDGFTGMLYRQLNTHVDMASKVYHQYMTRDTIVMAMLGAFCIHIALHCAALRWLVPYFGHVEAPHNTDIPYEEIAEKEPCNWFNANPVFCLRSKYFYRHGTPCSLFQPGKEYLLKKNTEIGQHYHLEHTHIEDDENLKDILREMRVEVQGKMEEIKEVTMRGVSRFRRGSGSGVPTA